MRKKKVKTVPRSNTSTKKVRVYKKKAAVAKKARKGTAPKVRGLGTLTETEYFSKIRSALRKAFRFWPPMAAALKKASRPSQNINKRIKVEYLCNHCNKWFQRREVEIDHVIECGSLKVYEDIVPFLKRLTEENIDSYQILCKSCHSIKTKAYLSSKKIK